MFCNDIDYSVNYLSPIPLLNPGLGDVLRAVCPVLHGFTCL